MKPSLYLDRIGFVGTPGRDFETLRMLHLNHLMRVPFENLDIERGVEIVLDTRLLFEKIVIRRRGGFCYELNGLFCELLRTIGFNVEMLSGRVVRPDGSEGMEFDHMLLLVDGRWIADVGFGDSFCEPIPLEENVFEQATGTFELRRLVEGWELGKLSDGEFHPQYRFGEQPYELHDYIEMCVYQQTSPESHFTRNTICSRLVENGRITISGDRLIETLDGDRIETAIDDPVQRAELLRARFGIELDR
ncbi:MAG: arylamine N-acetyltransferase [Pyrinomonadaceae bacterium]